MWNPKMPLITAAGSGNIAEMLVRANRRRLSELWIENIDRSSSIEGRTSLQAISASCDQPRTGAAATPNA